MRNGYQNTIIGEIPEDWKIKRLKEVSSFSNGKGHEQFIDEHGKYIVVNSKFISSDGEVRKYSNKNLCPLNKGDITMVMSDIPNGKAIAKCFVVDENDRYSLNQRIGSIKALNHIDTDFLYYILNRNKYYLAFDNGVGQTNLRKDEVLDCPIQLPPFSEQQKIARIIRTVDERIVNIDQQIKASEQLKKGMMQRLLKTGIGHTEFKDSPLGKIPKKWESLTFGDIVTFSGGAQPPRSTFKFEQEVGYIRLIQTRDYKSDKYITYIPEELARKTCKKDDIMIGRYGPPIFQILRGLEGAYNVALLKAIPNEDKLHKEYLYYYISQYNVWAFVENLSQRSGGQTGVDLVELRKYPFPLPPLDEQIRIIDILKSIDDKVNIVRDKKIQYLNLKNGLMQQLLTGKKRVQI